MDRAASRTWLEWLLRIAVSGALVGHGAYGAVLAKPAWFTYFAVFGISGSMVDSYQLLTVVGIAEIAFGLVVLVWPVPRLLLFLGVWKIFTELLRPLAGEPFWEFVERGSNIVAPLALVYVRRQSTRMVAVRELSTDRSSAFTGTRMRRQKRPGLLGALLRYRYAFISTWTSRLVLDMPLRQLALGTLLLVLLTAGCVSSPDQTAYAGLKTFFDARDARDEQAVMAALADDVVSRLTATELRGKATVTQKLLDPTRTPCQCDMLLTAGSTSPLTLRLCCPATLGTRRGRACSCLESGPAGAARWGTSSWKTQQHALRPLGTWGFCGRRGSWHRSL